MTWFAHLAICLCIVCSTASANAETRYPSLQNSPDRNGDGAVDLEELIAFSLERVLAFDRDKDGRVSLDEWLGRLGAAADPHRAERVTPCFRARDANGDGLVDVAEVRAKAKEIFEIMDVDRDGRVTPQEWQAQINKPDVSCHL